jgi:hypothetical protein
MLRLPDDREGWPLGTCVHELVQEEGPATAAVDELGAPWVRIDVNWLEVERAEGTFAWAEMDRMVDTARAHGALVFATLAYTPGWATDGGERLGVPYTVDHYRRFVAATVERYRDRVKHWGLWNEPEQGGRFWSGTPEQFVDFILRPGFEAVRATDPEGLVLGPDSGSPEWLDRILLAGGGAYIDVFTLHVYACCDDTDNVAKVLWRLDGTGGLPWDESLRRVIERNGLGEKPVWVTEVGWKTLTPDWEGRQADYEVGLLDAMLARPWWTKTIFYELYDATPCDPAADNCWGIVRTDWSRKPAFVALRDWLPAHVPQAEAGPDVSVRPGVELVLDGTASADPDGTLVLHRWDFDRSDGVYAEAEGAVVTRVYDRPGTYVATLVVTDDHGLEDADTVTVDVGGLAPCETETTCASIDDCALAPIECACPGAWTCNAAGRCQWRCDDVPDGGPTDTTPDGPVDDVGLEVDEGTDAEAVDASDARDVGGSPAPPAGGCTCAAAAAGDGRSPTPLLALALLLVRRRGARHPRPLIRL